MKKFLWSIVAIALVAGGLYAADWTRSYPLDWGPPGDTRTEMLAILDDQADEIFTFLNDLKDGQAGTTAPGSPNEGELWFDTTSSEMKQWHASTWDTIYSYASTTSIDMVINELTGTSIITSTYEAAAGTVDSLYASTITAPYATVTDVDVITATIGSATVNTLSTANWSQDTATFNTLTVTGQASFPAAWSAGVLNADPTLPASAETTIVWDAIIEDNHNIWESTTNPERIGWPSGATTVQMCVSLDARATTVSSGPVYSYIDGYTSGDAFTWQREFSTFINFTTITEQHRIAYCTGPVVETDISYFLVKLGNQIATSSLDIPTGGDRDVFWEVNVLEW